MTVAQPQVPASHTNGNHEFNNYYNGYSSFVNPPNQTVNGHNLPNNPDVPMNPSEGAAQEPQTDAQNDQEVSTLPNLETSKLRNSCVSLPLPDSPTLSVLEARRRQAQTDKKSEEKTDQQPKKEISKDESINKEEEEKDVVKKEEEEAKDLTPSPESSTSRQTDPDFQP
ncbi:hypothetical protein C7M61_000310 [Candidozyma pseudohaemuli]|uniref:Uncharacterized protein n=1 Tax=Candidozyma pseudohaemuli TaxID=418784 RepID=A0A2P7YXI9_9ASCO|nr:hypothetical protein C7M61_000310 [[Candida] pseudohaemulonii]PSK40662.1 hypothetical protein C7M61_000310 [[Candida] pseudohaemulonii]